MKITRKSQNKLQFIHIPIVGFGLGLAISAIPLFISISASRTAVLNCYRNGPGIAKAAKSGECKIQRRSWLPNSQVTEFYYLDEIHSASAPTSDDNSSLVIVLQDGEIVQLSGVSTSDDKSDARDAINQFLKDPKIASVNVKDGNAWSATPVVIIAGIVSALIFFSVLFLSYISICCFDKTSRRMSLTIFGVLGKSSIRYDLSQVVAVELAEWGDGVLVNYPLRMIVREADPIPLTFTASLRKHEKQKLADRINDFLKVA
jgi:hypothetical protein